MFLYNATTNKLNFYNGNDWEEIASTTSGSFVTTSDTLTANQLLLGNGGTDIKTESDLTFDGNIFEITASVPILNLVDTFDPSTTGSMAIASEFIIAATMTTGDARFDFNSRPLDALGDSIFRFGRSSGSVGDQILQFFENNSTSVQTQFSSSGLDSFINALGGNLNIGASGSATNLSLDSDDGALRLNRLTSAQRDALPGTEGQFIYNDDDNKLNVFTTVWEEVLSTAGSTSFVTSSDTLTANNLVMGNGGTDLSIATGLTYDGDGALEINSEFNNILLSNPSFNTELQIAGSITGAFTFQRTTGSTAFNFNARPLDLTSQSIINFGQSSASTGSQFFRFFENNSSTVQTQFASSGEDSFINALGGDLNIGANAVATTVSLDSNLGALRLNRLTTTERDALTALEGMFIYNDTDNKVNVFTTVWEEVPSSTGGFVTTSDTLTATQLLLGNGATDIVTEGDLTYDGSTLSITDGAAKLSLVNTGVAQFDIETSTGNLVTTYSKNTTTAVWDFTALPLDGTSSAVYRFGMQSGSTGTNQLTLIDNNSGNVQTRFSSSNFDSHINAFGGRLGIGTSSFFTDTVFNLKSPSGLSTDFTQMILESPDDSNLLTFTVSDDDFDGGFATILAGNSFLALGSDSGVSFYIGAGGNIGINEPMPATVLHIASTDEDATPIVETESLGANPGTTQKFVGNRDPNGNITGAGGDEYYRDDGVESGSYESQEATTGLNWFKRSVNPPTIIEIFNVTQLNDLVTSGTTITVDGTSLTLILKATIGFTVDFNVINGGELQITSASDSINFVYANVNTLFVCKDSMLFLKTATPPLSVTLVMAVAAMELSATTVNVPVAPVLSKIPTAPDSNTIVEPSINKLKSPFITLIPASTLIRDSPDSNLALVLLKFIPPSA